MKRSRGSEGEPTRSRGGCSHCRRLRIKCDQQFPTCHQCTKRRRVCDLIATGFRSYTPAVAAHMHTSPKQDTTVLSPTVSESMNNEPYSLHETHTTPDSVTVPPTHSSNEEVSRDIQMLYFQSPSPTTISRSQVLRHNTQSISRTQQNHTKFTQQSSLPVLPLGEIADHAPQNGLYRDPALIEPSMREDSFGHSVIFTPDRNSQGSVLPASTTVLKRSFSLSHRPNGIETSRERSLLLRHFSTTPGRWMDLFDLDCFYSRQVPALALNSQLIMYSACALAAKQLSVISEIPAHSLPHSTSTAGSDGSQGMSAQQDHHAWVATTYYDAAISLLLQRIADIAASNNPSPPAHASERMTVSGRRRSSELATHTQTPANPLLEPHDEVVVAVTIMAIYEFLGGDTPTWSDHLDGTRSFLRISDEAGLLDFHHSPSPNNISTGPSSLLRATFWNFARQDMLSAFISGKHTRLEIHDFAMWRRMGVSLCSDGFLLVGHKSFHPDHNIDRIDMISNTLVWLLCRIVNLVASCGDDMENLKSETLRETWDQLKSELESWFMALPKMFQPCSRVLISRIDSSRERNGCCNHGKALVQHETWYSDGMCASTMQSYYMAEIILALYKPRFQQARIADPTLRSNFSVPKKSMDALSELNRMSAELQKHAIEICAIAISYPEEAARIHMLQPLYLAGRCLSDHSDRVIVVSLIESIEDELGWHAKYRVEALLEEWDITREALACCH